MSQAEPAVVRMGNDIVRNVIALDDDQRAVDAATHIEKFWEPRMRSELIALARADDPSMDPVLRTAAIKLVRDETDDAEIAAPSGG